MSEEKVEVIFGLGTANQFSPNWTSLLGRKSLDELCHYIEVETSLKDRQRISKHMRFGVYYSRRITRELVIERRPVLTGYVDNVDLECSAKRSIFKFNGRSAARNIVDSKWSATIRGKTLFGVVKTIADQFGIECFLLGTQSGPGGKATDYTGLIEDFSFENESPWPLIQQEAANQGVLVTSSQTGGLYVWKVATGLNRWGFALKEGQNGTTFKDQESGSNQFHKYIFKGDGLTSEGYDRTCRDTSRILTVNLPDRNLTQAKLDRRVKTEIRRRRERKIVMGVSSWALPSALIEINSRKDRNYEIFWETNFLTPVQIQTLAIDATLLTSQIEYRADKSTMSCDVQLSNPEEFQ